MRHPRSQQPNSERELPREIRGRLFKRTLSSSGDIIKPLCDFRIQLRIGQCRGIKQRSGWELLRLVIYVMDALGVFQTSFRL